MPKKEFTSFDTYTAVHELKDGIANSRVSNVYQLGAKTLLFKLHKTGKLPLRLVMEAGRRLHLTNYALENPLVPPAFCMAIRKYLRNAWLTSVEQHEFERIVTFHFKTKTGMMRLILELFGEGNIILIGENDRILQALIFKRMRDRNILRNEVFQFPPSTGKDPFRVTMEELENALKELGDVEVVRGIARFIGIGGVYAEEILLRANIEKTKRCNTLTNSENGAIFDCLQSLLSTLSDFKIEPQIVLAEDGNYMDALPFRLKRYGAFKSQSYNSFNEALDEFYVKVTAAEKAVASTEIDGLQREAERLKRVIAEQEQTLREAESKSERDKRIGDVIYEHLSDLQTLSDKVSTAKTEGKDWKAVADEVAAINRSGRMREVSVENLDMRTFAINVCIDNQRFGINLRKTLFENAAEYYERGKRAKQKSIGAEAALEEFRKKLAEIEQKISEAKVLQEAKPTEVLKELVKRKVESKEWYKKFRSFTSSEGFLVVAGKDAVSNEVLVKKHTDQLDAVFHAEITGAPFVVVKTEGKEPSEQTLREAGEFAVAFSRAWREGFGSADVYWVKPDQLSKSGPSGEYVPHGAFAVSGKRNWMRNVPLRLAIAVVENGEIAFVGGPVEAVKAKAKAYILLEPGDAVGKGLLKGILRALMFKLPKEQREKFGKTSIEQIREFVPYAKGRVIEAT